MRLNLLKERKEVNTILSKKIIIPILVSATIGAAMLQCINNKPTEVKTPTTIEVPAPVQKQEDDGYKFVANVSWYTADPAENGGWENGITASGKIAEEGRTIACDHLPLGTKVKINNHIYTVEDTFGGGYTDRIDIYCQDKDTAWSNGRQFIEVTVLKS